jgi:hypothetical protein
MRQCICTAAISCPSAHGYTTVLRTQYRNELVRDPGPDTVLQCKQKLLTLTSPHLPVPPNGSHLHLDPDSFTFGAPLPSVL